MRTSVLTLHRDTNPPVDDCAICFEPLNNGKQVYGHESFTDKTDLIHLFHKKCYIKIKDARCPLCRFSINLNSLFSWTDHLKNGIKTFIPNALIASAGAALIGGSSALISGSFELVPAAILWGAALSTLSDYERANRVAARAEKVGCDRDAVIIGIYTGLVSAVINSSSITSAITAISLVGGIVAGVIAVKKPHALAPIFA